jgi:hypothetical protein
MSEPRIRESSGREWPGLSVHGRCRHCVASQSGTGPGGARWTTYACANSTAPKMFRALDRRAMTSLSDLRSDGVADWVKQLSN